MPARSIRASTPLSNEYKVREGREFSSIVASQLGSLCYVKDVFLKCPWECPHKQTLESVL